MKQQYQAKVIPVTPEMAKRWGERNNNHNRPLYYSVADVYARDMKNGLWKVNNQGIGFDWFGNLIDGQHRLMAIVISGKTVPMLVVKGLDPEAQATVDMGKYRKAGDVLALNYNVENANRIAAIINALIGYIVLRNKNIKISVGIMRTIMGMYEREIRLVMANKQHVQGLTNAPILAAMVFAAKTHPDHVVQFEQKYFSGEMLGSKDPAFVLREYARNKNRPKKNSISDRQELCDRTLNSLLNEINKKKTSFIYKNTKGHAFFVRQQRQEITSIMDLLKN